MSKSSRSLISAYSFFWIWHNLISLATKWLWHESTSSVVFICNVINRLDPMCNTFLGTMLHIGNISMKNIGEIFDAKLAFLPISKIKCQFMVNNGRIFWYVWMKNGFRGQFYHETMLNPFPCIVVISKFYLFLGVAQRLHGAKHKLPKKCYTLDATGVF